MKVLYKSLTQFPQLMDYLQQNELHTICSNVAISCAIHDQNLDESWNILGKTTTNISAEDFCKDQDVGIFFQGNEDQFNQFEIIQFMKEHSTQLKFLYDKFADQNSKDHFFHLCLFFLCPYTHRFFQDSLTPNPKKILDYTGGLAPLTYAKKSLMEEPKPLHLALGTSFSDFIEIPLFLTDIKEYQQFTLDIHTGDTTSYFVVLSAVPETPEVLETPVLSETTVISETPVVLETPVVSETAVISETPVVLETPVVSETTVISETPVVLETPVIPESKVVSDTAVVSETQVLTETPVLTETQEEIETPTSPEEQENSGKTLENPVLTKDDILSSLPPELLPPPEANPLLAPPSPIFHEEETLSLEQELEEVDVAKPDFPLEPVKTIPEEELTDSVEEIQALTHHARAIVEVDAECLSRSIQLLHTMEELVTYLKTQYTAPDPLCSELLESMLKGVAGIRKILDTESQ